MERDSVAFLPSRELYIQCTNLSRRMKFCNTAKREYCCTLHTYPSMVERLTNIEMMYAMLSILVPTVRDDVHCVLILVTENSVQEVLFPAEQSTVYGVLLPIEGRCTAGLVPREQKYYTCHTVP
jgi:hypothetical protein